MAVVDEDRYVLKYDFPYSEIVTDFFDKIKAYSKGFGSLDFDFSGYKKSNIRKLIILLMGEPVDALSFMVQIIMFDFII